MAETWGQSKVRSRGRAELKPWDSAGRGGALGAGHWVPDRILGLGGSEHPSRNSRPGAIHAVPKPAGLLAPPAA